MAEDYKKGLGLLESISIIIGRIIGSGIFRTPGPIMALTLSPMLFGLSWIIGGIMTILAAISYAELVAMIPKSGGPYQYLKMAYPPVWAFLRGWAMFFVSETGAIAAVSIVFAEYLKSLLLQLFQYELPPFFTVASALAIIWIHTFINFAGVRFSGKIQNIISFLKYIALFSISMLCFSSSQGTVENYFKIVEQPGSTWQSILALGAAMRYTFFAFSGWEGATYVAEEVKNPGKNLPLSLFAGIGAVFLLYATVNAAYLYQLHPAEMALSKHVATSALIKASGTAGAIFISAVVMLSTFGNVGTQVLVKARSWQAMARDKMFFHWLAPTDPVNRTPDRSLLVQALWASLLLFFASLAENTYETIIDFFSATSTIFNIMTFAALIILRKKYPDMERPYKSWLYPWSSLFIIIFYLSYLGITIYTAPLESLAGLALTGTGLIYYYGVIKKKLKPA